MRTVVGINIFKIKKTTAPLHLKKPCRGGNSPASVVQWVLISKQQWCVSQDFWPASSCEQLYTGGSERRSRGGRGHRRGLQQTRRKHINTKGAFQLLLLRVVCEGCTVLLQPTVTTKWRDLIQKRLGVSVRERGMLQFIIWYLVIKSKWRFFSLYKR